MELTKKKILISLLSTILLIIGIGATVALVKNPLKLKGEAFDKKVAFTLTGSSSSVDANEGLNVAVAMNTNEQPVSAVELILQYDPNLLAVSESDIDVGALLPIQLGQVKVNNVAPNLNELVISLSAQCTALACTPAIQPGNLVTVFFESVAKGSGATIALSPSSRVLSALNASENAPSLLFTSNTVAVAVNSEAVALMPVADSYVKKGFADKNYSSESSLVASNFESSNQQVAYLKFDLSQVNRQILKAQLKITPVLKRTVSKTISLVPNSSWQEQTLTWNNKPASTTALGNVGGPVTVGTPVVVELDPATLNEYLGKAVTLSVGKESDGANTLEFSSKEVSQKEPQLLLELASAANSTAKTYTMLAKEDSYVQSAKGEATKNYGTKPTLVTSSYESSSKSISFLKFNNAELAGKSIQTATLIVTPTLSRTIDKVIKVVPNSSWTEKTLTYSNRPAFGETIGTIPLVKDNSVAGKPISIELDASKLLVDSSGNISIAIENNTGSNTLSMYSKDNLLDEKKPKLILEAY